MLIRRSPVSLMVCFALAAAMSASAFAAKRLEDVSESAPPPPSSIEDGQTMQPEITIEHRKDATVEEYRVSGRLYMVKVTPVVGPPYYLVDNNGDGRLSSRIDTLAPPTVPRWVIFSW